MGDDAFAAGVDGNADAMAAGADTGPSGGSADGGDRIPEGEGPRNLPLVGDDLGLALFLGGLVATGLTWQIGVFITDSYAVANALRNVAAGHLHIERVYYGLTIRGQPGLRLVGDQLYARNYGQVFLALPVYYALDALSAVADLRHLLIGIWSLLVFAFARQGGRLAGRPTAATIAGSALALALFWTNVSIASPFDNGDAGIAALQIVSMMAVAGTGLAVYRLVDRFHGSRAALAAGCAVIAATPLWFWAPIPKRHTLTAAGVAIVLYCFAASRRPDDRFALRVTAYVAASFVVWVHAFEGVLVLGILLVADLATAPSTSKRQTLALALVLAVSFAPILATNAVVTGDPTEPPRLAGSSPYWNDDVSVEPDGAVAIDVETGSDESPSGSDGGTAETDPSASDADGPAGSDPPGDGTAGADGPPVFGALDWAQHQAERVLYADRFASTVGSAPERTYRTYVRSGRIESGVSYGVNDEEAIELTLLESLPVAGVLVGGVALALGRIGSRARSRPAALSSPGRALTGPVRWLRTASPARQTDLLACLVVAGLAVIYFPFLPLHSQLTVRYVLPMVPALVYLAVRIPAVRTAVDGAFRPLVGGYAVSVAIGLIAVAVGLPVLEPAIGEAVQLHALVNLCACGIAAGLVLARTAGADVSNRAVALALALAAAATTVLLVAMQLEYFEYGTPLLPAVRAVADAIPVLG